MHAGTQFARPFALVAAIISSSMLTPAQDAKTPAPTPPPLASQVVSPAVEPPAAAPSDETPSTDSELDDERLRDALEDFWGERTEAPGPQQDSQGRAIDGWGAFPDFQPFALRFDPRAFATGSGGAMSLRSTTIEAGVEKRIHVEVDAEGKARATITSTEANGDKSERKFEADDLDTLRRQAPELEALLGGSGAAPKLPQLQPFQDLFGAWPFGRPGAAPAPRGLQRLPSRAGTLPPVAPADANGPRLGVQIRAIPSDDPLRAHLRLERDVGLLVESVVPGSLAERLGVQRYDVITKIDALPIGDAADVLLALKEADDGLVEVHVLRAGKPILLTHEPAASDD